MIRTKGFVVGAALLVAVMSESIFADVVLPSVISDGMILQRNAQVPIFGKASPGEAVRVQPDWIDRSFKTVAEPDGRWSVTVPTGETGAPHSLTVHAGNTITLTNILFGEVWLCSGQSNMEMRMKPFPPWHGGTLNYQQEIDSANYPDIRFFYVEKRASRQPEFTCKGKWESCTPASVSEFSAVGYFFARQIYKELGVPVGIINSSWGSTAIESWMPLETLKDSPDFKAIADTCEAEKKKTAPDTIKDFWLPSACYNGLIAPVVPYALRGIIWQQGQSNVAWPEIYEKLFPALINSWRAKWNLPEMPFYFVQLEGFDTAAHSYPGVTPDKWARLRQSQMATLSLTNTGMAVAADIGDPLQIHPRNKQDVGRRLALWALAECYGKNIAFSGPLYKSMKISGKEIILSFDCTNGGLMCKGGRLDGFIIAGKDRRFVKAQAEIVGNTIVVKSPEVTEPVAVRYGWTDDPHCTLYNEAQLPAAPFRTDSWESGIVLE